MEFIANFMTVDVDPMSWAADREAEGWQVLGCADHFWSGTRAYPHVWVTLAAMAAATERTLLTTSFANNLFRSPVEFAQASLTLQAVSDGRFEAGLGAGWSRDECTGSALGYPEPRERAGRLIEAVQIVRQLFDHGSARFTGRYYDIDVARIDSGNRRHPAPPLVASLGGPRTVAGATPYLDRVELKLNSAATKGGALDLPKLAEIPESHLHEMVASVRAIKPDIPISVFILCSVGDDPQTKMVEQLLGDSFFGGFFGPAEKVAASMLALADAGINRVQVSPFIDQSFSMLAPLLFAR